MASELIEPSDPHKEFLRWKLYCHTHAQSILELSPQLTAVVKKYSIKKLHELGLACPSVKGKVDDYLKMFLRKGQAEKIAAEFNVDMYCIYEDFVELVEMLYKAAEEAYQDEMEQNVMDNYLEIIAVYRLIVDLTDLTVLWKEKDENIKRFVLFCKHRVVSIMDRKSKPLLSKEQLSIDKEIEQMNINEEVKRGDPGDNKEKDRFKTDEELIEEFTTEGKREKKADHDEEGEELKDFLKEEMNILNRNAHKEEEDDVDLDEYIREEKAKERERKGEDKSFYSKLLKGLAKKPEALNIEPKSKSNANKQEKPKEIPKQTQSKPQQPSAPLIHQNANKPIILINKEKHKSKVIPNKSNTANQKSKEAKPKQKVINQSKHNSSFTSKRDKAKKDDYYINELESMLKDEANSLPLQPKAEKDQPNPKPIKQTEPPIIDINADYNAPEEEMKVLHPFKQIATPMLAKYKYPGNGKYKGKLPVRFKQEDYAELMNCIRNVLLPMIEKDVQAGKNGKALHESEMILYYLSNIIP